MALYETLKSSDRQTSGTVVMDEKGYFGGIIIETDGSTNAVVNGYDDDSEATTGTQLFPEINVAAADFYGGFFPPKPIYCNVGCYITITGNNAAFVAYYRPMEG